MEPDARPAPTRAEVAGAALAAIGLGVALAAIPAFRAARVWYPDHGFAAPWVALCGALYAAAQIRRRAGASAPLTALWVALLAPGVAGFVDLLGYTLARRCTGDLFLGVFLGAQRVRAGVAVYDLAGLQQSVNATPFAIALLTPFGHLSGAALLPGWLALQAVWLAVGIAALWSLADRAMRARGGRAGVPELGLIFAVTVGFNALQRSVRLGQFDLLLFALLAAGIALLAVGVAGRARAAALGGALGGGTAALKILPVLALGPPAVAALGWWRRRRDPRATRAVASALLALALTAGAATALGVGVVSPREAGRFVQNLATIQRGSSLGVNHAVVARAAKYREPWRLLRHAPLEARDLRWLNPLRGITLALWILVARRASPRAVAHLAALGVASAPLFSAACWAIYFVWVALLPWCIALPTPAGARPLAALRAVSPALQRALRATLMAGSFALLGLAGSSVTRALDARAVAALDVPPWFDEAKLLGLALLIAHLAWRVAETSDEGASGDLSAASSAAAADRPSPAPRFAPPA
ncbi:MAG: hypothetical protein U0325_20225 [Polyangiales bacterium]